MFKKELARFYFWLPVALLIVSVGINVLLFQQVRTYYVDLNGTRLDPLGLNAYPSAPHTNINQPLVLFFGDSRAADWPAPVSMPESMFVNRGIGAQTTAQILGRFAAHVLPLHPDVVVVQMGINDLKTIPLFPEQREAIVAQCKANIAEVVALARADGTQVVLTTIFPLGQIPLARRPFWSEEVAVAITDVNQFILAQANDHVLVFDTGVILAKEDGLTNPLYSQDFLHLNEKGYEVLNSELVPLLRPQNGLHD